MFNDDEVNPNYYQLGGIEQVDYNRSRMTPPQFEGFLLGDLYNYLGRYNFKNSGAQQLLDLKKARWYLDKLISFKESELSTSIQNTPIVKERL